MQYVFQILAQLLESSPPQDAMSENYKTLLTPLLHPPLWESRGNVPSCTRLLCAVIPRSAPYILAENKIEQVLGIFQQLIAFKKTELHGLDLIEAVIKAFEP